MERRIPELRFTDYTQGPRGRRETFTDALMRGLQHYGFIILRDHPVPAPRFGDESDEQFFMNYFYDCDALLKGR